MTSNWVAKALGQKILAAGQDDVPVPKEAVILLNGKNPFGDRVYAYLHLTFESYSQMLEDIKAGKKFNPSEYGEVIAAGKGEPEPDLQAEMATKYQLVDVPKPRPATTNNFSAPKVWGMEDEEDGNT